MKKNGESKNTWRLKKWYHKNQWIKEDIKEQIRKYLKSKENGNITFKKSKGNIKVIDKGKFYSSGGISRSKKIKKKLK